MLRHRDRCWGLCAGRGVLVVVLVVLLVLLVLVLVVLVVLVVALGLPARGLGPGGAVPGQPRSPAQRRRQAPQSARAYSIPIAGTPRTVRLRQQ